MTSKIREKMHKPRRLIIQGALLHPANVKAAPPPTADRAPPGVCDNWDVSLSATSQLSQTPEVRVRSVPISCGFEDLLVAAGLFDEQIARILSARRAAFGITTSQRRKLCDLDPALKPMVVSRR